MVISAIKRKGPLTRDHTVRLRISTLANAAVADLS